MALLAVELDLLLCWDLPRFAGQCGFKSLEWMRGLYVSTMMNADEHGCRHTVFIHIEDGPRLT